MEASLELSTEQPPSRSYIFNKTCSSTKSLSKILQVRDSSNERPGVFIDNSDNFQRNHILASLIPTLPERSQTLTQHLVRGYPKVNEYLSTTMRNERIQYLATIVDMFGNHAGFILECFAVIAIKVSYTLS